MSRAIELTKELVRFNTINPPGDERICAQHLGRIYEQAGFKISYHEFADKRTSLVARIGGSADKKPICFTGHIDIVPLGRKAWSKDPFAGETDGDKMYGRGVSDMKAGVAAFTIVMQQLAKKLERSAGVIVVITADEEKGCGGANHLEASGVLGHAGAIVVAEPTGNYPMVGHKGAFWVCAKTRGKTAHGSMPQLGDNAVYKAARAVSKLETYDFGKPHAHAALGLPSLNVGVFQGGLNYNSVPDEAMIGIDMRTTPNQDHAKIKADLQRHLGVDVELEAIMDVPSVYTDPNDPWMQHVFDTVTPFLGKRPEPITGPFFTDAAALRKAFNSPPTVVLGPGEAAQAHQTDEYAHMSKIEQSVDYFTTLARNWCGI